MSDPFQSGHAAKRRAEAAKQAKGAKDQMLARVKAGNKEREAAAKRNPNDDIGYRWPRKFYEPS